MATSLLSKWFRRAGCAMEASPATDETVGLKNLVQLAHDLRKNRVFLQDPSERYIAFLTERYIRAVHGNLFMDTPFSQDLRDTRSSLLKVISASLKEMAEGLDEGDHGKAHQGLSKSVNYYLEIIEKLNAAYAAEHLEQKGGVR